MVEGAIVASMFVLMLACMWAALSFQKAKIHVMARARADAWPAALNACAGQEDAWEDVANEVNDANSGPLPNTNQSDQYVDLDKSALAVRSGHVSVEKKQAIAAPGVIGGTSLTMRGRMFLRCNEPKPPETAKQFFKQGFSVLKATAGF